MTRNARAAPGCAPKHLRGLGLLAGLALIGCLLLPTPALAHGLVGKQDLPIPRWLFAWAATTVLVVSFAALAALWNRPHWQDGFRTRTLLRVPRLVEPVCGAIGVAVFVVAVYAGLAGSQMARDNVLPTLVYVLFWVGIPFASVVFGDVFRAFNPWLAVGRAAGWITSRLAGDAVPEPLPYPSGWAAGRPWRASSRSPGSSWHSRARRIRACWRSSRWPMRSRSSSA